MAITFGSSGAPSQETRNFDSLFTTSLSNYSRQMFDNISTSNAFFMKLKGSKGYVSLDGGTDAKFPVMYALGEFDWYEGYDTLDTAPMDGHTQTIWEWREASIPITVSRRELVQNKQNLMPLVSAKIQQAEMGIMEGMAKAILQGNAALGGTLTDPQVSAVTGASSFDPLPKLVQKDPTASDTVGNIAQNTHSWWRNQTKSSTASTYDGFLAEVQGIYNDCSKGPGGPPDLILCDQYTYQMFERMLYNRGGSRHAPGSTLEFPFENLRWKNSMVTWDEFVPDVSAGTATVAVDSSTGGTMYFLNTKFLKVFYESGTNFIQTDWMKAYNQPNAQTKHILWMGGTAVTNRRKNGVLYGIDTTIAS